MTPITFPIGFYQFHPNASMNFQMNRWYSWVGEKAMLDDLRAAAPRIANYADWKREFLALAVTASNDGHTLRAGFYFRAADFFMQASDPDRHCARQNFLSAIRSVYGLDVHERHAITYTDGHVRGFLPAYRFTPGKCRGTIVFFGGFDSYIEELTSAFFYLRDAGYEVIAFEGPGQGGALNDAGLHLTVDWHKPVKAVLDHFQLDRITLIGLSMGGCLVLRTAAFEPRVERVVAYNIYPNSLKVNLRQVNPVLRALMKVLLYLQASPVVNLIANRVAKKNPIAEWGIEEGMHVTGTTSPYEYFQKIKLFHTQDVSALVKQDVLLLAGSEDHLLPLEDFYWQIEMLKNARSLTARLFAQCESAQSHCQVGNYGLAFSTIVNWLEGLDQSDRYSRHERSTS